MSYTYKYPKPSITTDCIIFSDKIINRKVLLIKRKNEPFKNKWALPGGFLDMEEDIVDCALRELKEECGIEGIHLEQFYTVGTLGRDPRGRTVSVIYIGFVDDNTADIKAGDDASEAAFFNIDSLPELAFDHLEIITKAIKHITKS